MQRVQNITGPVGDGISEWETGDIAEPDDETLNYINIFPKEDLTKYYSHAKEPWMVIAKANKSISLAKCFDDFNIEFQQTYSPSGWSLKSSCPFPDHSDSSPSFFYNQNENIFNCFGCSRGGGPVQFYAYLENIEPFEVAKRILNDNQNIENIDIERQESLYTVKDVLFDFALTHYQFLEDNKFNKRAKKFAHTISSVFDLFLRKSAKENTINRKEIQARLDLCKQKFKEFA